MAQSDLPTVIVNVFPGGFNWGVYVGQSKGFFAEARHRRSKFRARRIPSPR